MADDRRLKLERRWRANPADDRTLEALLSDYRRARQDPPWDALAASPRWRAFSQYSNNKSGVRCAETLRVSQATPSCCSVSAAFFIVSQSD